MVLKWFGYGFDMVLNIAWSIFSLIDNDVEDIMSAHAFPTNFTILHRGGPMNVNRRRCSSWETEWVRNGLIDPRVIDRFSIDIGMCLTIFSACLTFSSTWAPCPPTVPPEEDRQVRRSSLRLDFLER